MPNRFYFLHLATGTGHLTVGKLYGGILIHDNWRKTKFGQIEELRKQVMCLENYNVQCFKINSILK